MTRECEIRTSPKNEPENQAVPPSLTLELTFPTAADSQDVLPGARTCMLSGGCQDRCRHPGPHQHSCVVLFPAQLGKGISTNLKREPVLMKSAAWRGC